MKRTKYKLHPNETICPSCGHHFTPKVQQPFVPPTKEQVSKYARSKGYIMDGSQFVAYHTSAGWKVGSKPMVSWKQAVITWANNSIRWGDGEVRRLLVKNPVKVNVGFQNS